MTPYMKSPAMGVEEGDGRAAGTVWKQLSLLLEANDIQ